MSRLFLFAVVTTFALVSSSSAGLIVIGNLVRTATVEPGERFEGVIFLKNTSDQSVDVRVSQTDYVFSADGSNDYGEPGTAARSNAGWITVTPTLLKLGPGETVPVRYKGTVPADLKLRGTFWSMIMVEPDSTPAIAPGDEGVGLQTKIRFGVQMVTEVGQDGPRSLKILDRRIVYNEGKLSLELDVGNDGERLLVPAITVELFDQSGVSNGLFSAGRARIYPDCSVRASVDLTGLPVGKYTALVLLDSGDRQVMGAQYDLEIQ